MQIKDKVVLVTGGANGIGKALCERFSEERARAVVVVDIEYDNAATVAQAIGGVPMAADVSKEADIQRMIADTEQQFGHIDLLCSNAGVLYLDLPDWSATSLDNTHWQKIWEINVMAHVYAARAALPAMRARGEGYFLNTVSAAGLLNQIGSAAYSTTKHAGIGFAESLAITHGDEGIKVSVLCPQAVATRMAGDLADGGPAGGDGVISTQVVADCVVQGLADETFLLLPHPDVATYFQRKSADYDRWLGGMRKLRRAHMPVMEETIKA
ncbi:MAG: SDR family oxidoreductase [Pseudomonadales bacterium]